MTGERPRSGTARVLVALAALYGLLLQGFVAAMLPLPAAANSLDHVLCAPSPNAGAGDQGPVRSHDSLCCTLFCGAGAMPPIPDGSAASAARPNRNADPVLWTVADTVASTGPPTHATSARGPPAV